MWKRKYLPYVSKSYTHGHQRIYVVLLTTYTHRPKRKLSFQSGKVKVTSYAYISNSIFFSPKKTKLKITKLISTQTQ